ncbi:MAG TPA: hypothetical protein GXX37_03880 [Clostridiaceae bacterium]|nr:hypothetical protein [Clostridiaceae bacterium]
MNRLMAAVGVIIPFFGCKRGYYPFTTFCVLFAVQKDCTIGDKGDKEKDKRG